MLLASWRARVRILAGQEVVNRLLYLGGIPGFSTALSRFSQHIHSFFHSLGVSLFVRINIIAFIRRSFHAALMAVVGLHLFWCTTSTTGAVGLFFLEGLCRGEGGFG